MLSACDKNGFIIQACEVVERELSQDDPDPTRGTIDRDRFKLWIRTHLCPVLGSYDRMEARSVVVLDNASIHHDDEIVNMIEDTGAKVIYSAPFSPDLNPIEYMFAQYKKALKKYVYNAYVGTSAHMKALYSVTPRHAGSYFRHCGVPGCSHFPNCNGKVNDDDEGSKDVQRFAALSAIFVALIDSDDEDSNIHNN